MNPTENKFHNKSSISQLSSFFFFIITFCLKGDEGVRGTSRKKKISEKYNIGVINLKFTQYIPMMVFDIVYK